MSDPSAAAADTTRRLVAWQQLTALLPGDTGAAAEAVSARLRTVMVQWVGSEAWHALLQRSLEEVQPSFPVLAGAHCEDGLVLGLAKNGSTNGKAMDREAVANGFAGLVGALVGRLGRVVGEEMALRLVELAQDTNHETPSGEGSGGT
jgi:hypothetical protein